MNDYNSHYAPQASKFNELLQQIGTTFMDTAINHLQYVNSKLDDEFLLHVQERQVNEALARFVTRNVDMILDMNAELHQDWFRVYATIFFQGIYAKVACNFTLVHIQMDRQRQRFVFAQRDDTEILQLHCENFLHKKAIEYGVPLYRKIKKADLLGLLMGQISFIKVKDNIFYIDIGRWLKNDKKIMSYLYKLQINYATVAPEQLLLQSKVNARDLFATDETGDIITEKDKPQEDEVQVA